MDSENTKSVWQTAGTSDSRGSSGENSAPGAVTEEDGANARLLMLKVANDTDEASPRTDNGLL